MNYQLRLVGSTIWTIKFECMNCYAVDRAVNILHQIYGSMGPTVISAGAGDVNFQIPMQVYLGDRRIKWFLSKCSDE